MRKIVAFAALVVLASSPAVAQVYVQGHVRSDGTYVQPHWRSSPNSTTSDNWSTKGNVNPYTGEEGTRNPAPRQSDQSQQPKTQNRGSTYRPYGSSY